MNISKQHLVDPLTERNFVFYMETDNGLSYLIVKHAK